MIGHKQIGRFSIKTFNDGVAWIELHYNDSTSVIFHLRDGDVSDLQYALECIQRDAAGRPGQRR